MAAGTPNVRILHVLQNSIFRSLIVDVWFPVIFLLLTVLAVLQVLVDGDTAGRLGLQHFLRSDVASLRIGRDQGPDRTYCISFPGGFVGYNLGIVDI